MSTAKRKANSESECRFLQIVTTSESGAFVLALPPRLKGDQSELEVMLGKVFSGRRFSPDNLALAQQLSLNWCESKARSHGISFEECFGQENYSASSPS
jgi:hypothetical protein